MKKLLTFILGASITLGISFTQATEYSQELQDAYNRAYENGIITETSIENVGMFDQLTNMELARIITKYATNIVGLEPDTTKTCNFTDIDTVQGEMHDYIIKSCQLGLMPGNITGTTFDPYEYTNKAVFGSALSRVLWGSQNEGGNPYYARHLEALKAAGIMDQIDNPEDTAQLKGYTLLILMRTENYSTIINCKDQTIGLACLDPENEELYKECPVACRKNGILTNNLTKTAIFPVNEITETTVFSGTYTALENDTLSFFAIENIDDFELDYDPDYFIKRCEKDNGKNRIKFYLYINGEEISSITIDEACSFGYGAARGAIFSGINVTKGEKYKVKVVAEVNAFAEDSWNTQLILQNHDFSQIINNDTKANIVPIKIVDMSKLTIETGIQKKTVYLEEKEHTLATFTIKPLYGDTGKLDSITIRTWDDFSCSDIRFEVDGNEYDCHKTGNDLSYEINETINSTGAEINIILEDEYKGETMIGVMSINNQRNIEDGFPIPIITFVKRFEPALVYISKQENKGNYTEFTIGIDKSDEEYSIDYICMTTGSTSTGACLLGENSENGPFEDGYTFTVKNSDSEQPIEYVRYYVKNLNEPRGETITIGREGYPDYFEIGSGDTRKVFPKNNECIGMDAANVNHIISGDTITLTWNAVDGEDVQIAIFDPQSEIYKNLGTARMSDKKFNYKIQWSGEQNFMLTNGCKDIYYKAIANTGSTNSETTGTNGGTSSSSGKSSGGGGGGSSVNKTNTTKTSVDTTKAEQSTEKQSDKNEKKAEKTEQVNTKTQTVINKTTNYDKGNPSELLNNGYTREMNNAYKFAHDNGITTTKNIEKAKMNSPLTRIQMAKMLSNYAINVLGKEPDVSKGTVKFNDVTDKQNKNYDNAVTLAYQLGIMGQNMKNNNFRPNDEVNRAEFATALSRMLYGTNDGQGNAKYYETHMKKLYNEGIITKDNPDIKEKRGYVMIMLMRTAE